MLIFYLRNLSGGGVQKVHINIANGLERSGYDVIFLCKEKGVLENEVGPSIVKGTILKLFKLIPFLSKPANTTVVVGNGTDAVLAAIVRFLYLFRFNLIYVQHVDLKLAGDTFASVFVKRAVFSCLQYLVSRVVFVSNGLKESIFSQIKLPRSDFRVIYNPVLKSVDYAEHQSSSRGGGLRIINVGRLCFQKNQKYLLSVAEWLVNEGVDFKLTFVGEGEDQNMLTALVKEKSLDGQVEFLGWRDNIADLLKQADIFCLVSLWEGLPTVLIEALQYCPRVLALECPHGIREICSHDNKTVLPTSTDVSSYGRRLLELVDSAPVSMPSRNLERFTEKRCVREYELLVGEFK
ncbi:glycosyltransferase family 4 domain protein [Teredinibacter turnerae T7901]|uniref:Glycosyltransferase family 4 domain protein n=1 Tax=Teredinibacter turnerae (strain ATCC 39867 / T7901) TaxID=377629 RepID=C5BSL0_TERTT|nr:glycosyltransferase [Teredinibacter turnerae]ACR12160.1 glycosyltransferase family 4 domain protein [Teredinibacter turnerae T7901]